MGVLQVLVVEGFPVQYSLMILVEFLEDQNESHDTWQNHQKSCDQSVHCIFELI